MRNRMQGLKSECDMLLADLTLYQAGDRAEYDVGPGGERIDITDLWIEYIKARLAMKKSLIQKLKARYGDAGF
ncbi:MAG: hypothetical protein ABW197_03030, partial [Methyloceanibacter sp.]